MAKFRCVCGEVITTSGAIPNPNEWLYISDVDFGRYSGTVDAEELYQAFGRAFVCPRSGHIWIYKRDFEHDPEGYAPIENALHADHEQPASSEVDSGLEAEAVKTREDLAAFVRILRADLAEHGERWENPDLDRYLDALAAVVEDFDGWFMNRGESVPTEPSWQLVAQLLGAATLYE
jgi:hypothetical protein